MSDDQNENIAKDEDEVRPVQFITGGAGDLAERDHSNCHADSPCNRPDEFRALEEPQGVRGVVVEGEVWLNRADVLVLLANTMEAYMQVHNESKEKDDHPAAFSTFVSAQTINMLGAQLHKMTEMDRAIDLTVPDTIPTDWLSEAAPPAPESPIEAAIRKAKEAALAAKEKQQAEAQAEDK